MKIIHFADLHLGVENYGHTNPETGLSTRFEDFTKAFDYLVDFAINRQVDLVLFCGDAYKSREPSQTQQREFAKRIKRLAETGIPVFLLVGNHDLPNAIGRATSTEIFDTLSVKNVYVANKPAVFRIPTKNGTVQIASLPWLRRSSLLTREEMKTLDTEQLKNKMEQVLTDIIEKHVKELDSSIPAILTAHVWITGVLPGSEKSMSLGVEHGLLLSNVQNPAFDYVALGHIHKQQVLANNPPVVYSGSLERVDFGEEADDKGFYVLDIETDDRGKRSVKYEFQNIPGRRFVTVKVDVDADDMNPTAKVIQTLTAQPLKDAIVRLQITMTEAGSSRLNDSEIRNALKEAQYFTIARDTARETRLRLGKLTASELTPMEALKIYLETKNISPERTVELLKYGERMIEETSN
ncbi:MAG: exonuclease SbcCD subunit D [Dehalococcoidales bacterium]|nr:exonuclease SbcCD subunit D [Dehalococcoidales bacterium]